MCVSFMIWAITATSMIETPIAINTTTVPSTIVSVTNETLTEEIFESACVKVAVLNENQPTVSLKARFKIFHTMKTNELFTAMCDMIRYNRIFPGILYVLPSEKSIKT